MKITKISNIASNCFKAFLSAGVLILLNSCNAEEIHSTNNFNIIGETIALSKDKPSYLIKNDAKITRVYKRDENGKITIYRPNIDYLEVPNGGLQRTPQSIIPDFSTHKDDFKW